MSDRRHVVIVGGGFGGLSAARALRRAPVRVTLVDRRNHHLFQPLLYQVATAGLSAPDVAAPIRKVLRRQRNATVLLAEAKAIEAELRRVVLDDGVLGYDFLVLATGAAHAYFGHEEWARFAPGLKSIEDAFEIRRRVLIAFERAERETDAARQRDWLTFVVVGAGPTGVELAGALVEIAQRTLARDFRNFDPRTTHVVLLEAAGRVLPALPPELSHRARVLVEPDLSVPGRPEIFVVGDLAALQQNGEWIPAMAPPAIQGGRHAAANVWCRAAGRPTRGFRYRHLGSLATIGRSAAVAEVLGFRFAGWWAWALWLWVHILWLIGFRNRFVVLFDWAWAYLTYQRSARVILESVGPWAGAPPASGAGTLHDVPGEQTVTEND